MTRSVTWQDVNLKYQEGHKNILTLIDLVLSFPASTAECERGFSHMKIIKNDYRNKLHASTMTDLMTVKLISPEIDDCDPLPAVHHWNQSAHKSRRPVFYDSELSGQSGLAKEDILNEQDEMILPGNTEDAFSDYDTDNDSLYSDISDVQLEIESDN